MSQSDKKPSRRREADQIQDRLPPNSPDAEQGVLGCIFLSPNETIPESIEKLKSWDTMYDMRHQILLELLWDMHDAKEPIDIITVTNRLRKQQQLEQVGGVTYIASLPDKVPSAANLPAYLTIVREQHLRRRWIKTATEIIARTYEHDGSFDELMDENEKQIMRMSVDRIEANRLMMPKDLVHQAINKIEMLHQNQGQLLGISTGYPEIDKMTRGLKGGEMIVIAARPSAGKTSLAMNIAENVSVDEKIAVGVFSLEMTAESLMIRLICSRARVNIINIGEGFLCERDFPKITSAAAKLSNAKLYIDDSAGLSVMELRAKARRMVIQYGIKLFVIDYLQLLHSTSKRVDNRQQEIADISSGIKAIAKELNVPVIVLAQLNREMERENRKPRMSDLRESGAIEQDADLIGLLYKPKKDDADDSNNDETVQVNLLVAKQRNGPTGEVYLNFLKAYTRFESMSRVALEAELPYFDPPAEPPKTKEEPKPKQLKPPAQGDFLPAPHED